MIREKRYDELVKYARGVKRSDYLLTAHHKDDQNETFLHRLSFDSSLSGLKAISPLSFLTPSFFALSTPSFLLSHPLCLIRPLLPFTKERLIKVCEEFNEKSYVIDPSNFRLDIPRNRIRHSLSLLHCDSPSSISPIALNDDISSVINFCHRTTTKIQSQGRVLSDTTMRFDEELGYVSIDHKKFKDTFVESGMTRAGAESAIGTAISFVTGSQRNNRSNSQRVVSTLLSLPPTMTSSVKVLGGGGFIFTPNPRNNDLIICYENRAEKTNSNSSAIKLLNGPTSFLFDNRFILHFTILNPGITNSQRITLEKKKNFVCFAQRLGDVTTLAKEDQRKLKNLLMTKKLNRYVSATLPAITDESGAVLCVPHLTPTFSLKEADGITFRCDVKYVPSFNSKSNCN